jgi:YHS domain-containing protein
MWNLTGRLLLCVVVGAGWLAAEPPAPNVEAVRTALQHLNSVIGGWRGTGQPRRGSNQGAWRETGEFRWDFSEPSPAIEYAVTDGKLTTSVRVTFDPAAKTYVGTWQTPDNQSRQLTGTWQENQLVLATTEAGEQHRMTLTLLNDKRTLVLVEKRSSAEASYQRVAEIGYTREGTRLALPGGGQPECIVTGGAATIPVMHKGKTYYVCCTGCKQAFEDDPEGIIAEAAARAAKARE